MSPSCGSTQLGTSATPRTLQEILEVVDRETSSGLKKNEEKPQRHWTVVSSVKTTEGKTAEGCKIDRTLEDGVFINCPSSYKRQKF